MKVNLDQWYKCDIDRKVYKELTKRSDWQGIKHVSLWIVFLFLAGYMAFITWGTWWTVLWFLIYGNIYMACNPVWHECGHRTAFKTRWLNEIFYHIGSFMYNFEPVRWRWSHFHHHSYTICNNHEPNGQNPNVHLHKVCTLFPFLQKDYYYDTKR